MNRMIEQTLTACGYRKAQVFPNGAVLFAKAGGSRASLILSAFDRPEADITPAWLTGMRRYLESVYAEHNYTEINLLFLVMTPRIDFFRQDLKQTSPIWFIDSVSGRLVVFENQPADFDRVGKPLAEQLHRVQASRQGAAAGAGMPQPDRKDRFRNFIRHQGVCNLTIIAVNIAVFIWLSIIGNTRDAYFMLCHGAMFPASILYQHDYYRIFTSMFLHFGFMHLFNNMLVLFFLGDNLERAVGKRKYLLIYLGGGIIANLVSLFVSLSGSYQDYAVSAGASGAIFAVVGALLYIIVRNRGRLEDLRSGNLILLVVVTLYHGFTSAGVDNWAHIGGLLGGILLAALVYRRKPGMKANKKGVSKHEG